MHKGLNYLQTFNPIDSNAELLEKVLIGRKKLVDMLEQLVIESVIGKNMFQRLIIGPRGSGKTHLLRVLYNRVSSNTKLKGKLKIAYLCEDEYGIDTFLVFITRILNSFIKWDPEHSNYLEEEIEKLKKVAPHDQEKIAKQILLAHTKGSILLIIIENLGSVFSGLKNTGQAKLRDLVQQYPRFTIMATSQALFREVQDEDKPFHNYFKITHLKRLTLKEAISFLKAIAQWEKKTGLLKFLDEPEGKGRIRAIYDITGGNHRLLVTFYNFLKVDYKNDLSYSFIKTINDLIPYYQSFMNLLSAQQQKIIQYLCQIRNPTNVKEISENCFSAPNTISKQLSTLVKLKYVEGNPSGKETFYELAEPLLRICFEVKENRGGPVKLFIDFLGNLYSAQEIKKKYMHYHILSNVRQDKTAFDCCEEQFYYKETLLLYFQEELEHFQIDEFEKSGKEIKVQTYIDELEKAESYHEILEFTATFEEKDKYLLLKEATAYEKVGDIEREIETAKALLKKSRKDIDALILLGKAFHQKKEFKKSDNYFNKVLKINELNCQALNGLGVNMINQGKYEEAEQYFLKVLAIDPINEEAIEHIGISIGNQGRHEEAIAHFLKLIRVKPNYSNGWKYLAQAQTNIGELKKAEKNYLKAIKLDNKNSNAIELLGIQYSQQSNHNKALKYFKMLTEINPDYSDGWRQLGDSQFNLKTFKSAKCSYLKAIKLDEKNANAIKNIGIIHKNIGNHQDALTYFKKLTEIAPDYSGGWHLLGSAHKQLENIEEAKKCYLKAIEIKNENTDAIEAIGILIGNQGNHKEAANYFKKLTEIEPNYSDGWRLLGWANEVQGNLKNAKENYSKAIELNGKNTDAIKTLGVIVGEQGNHKEAANYFKKLTELVPDYSEGWRLLGVAHKQLENIEKAKRFYLKALEIDNENTNALKSLGMLVANQGDIKAAADYFKKLTELAPDYSEGWRYLGWTYENQGHIEDAKKFYLKSLDLNNENSNAIKAIGILVGNQGDHKEAANYFKKLTELMPDYSEGWRYLGWANENQGHIEDAKKFYLKSLDFNNKNSNAIYAIGILVGNQGDHKEATNYFKKLTEIVPDYSEGWNLLGTAYKNLENPDKAKSCYLNALRLNSENKNALEALGILIGNEDDHISALKYFQKLTELAPGYSGGWSLLGNAYINLEKPEQAKNCFLKALELNNKDTNALKNLGLTAGRIGDHKEAANHFKRLTELMPGYTDGWMLLGQAQFKLKKRLEAKKNYLKAIEIDENNLHALLGIASTLSFEGKLKEAEEYIERILEKSPKDADELNSIGEIYRNGNQFEKAAVYYLESMNTDNTSHHPYFNLVSCSIGLNDFENALSQIEKALEMAELSSLSDEILDGLEENFTTLFIHASKENISKYLQDSLTLIKHYMFLNQLSKAMPQAIFNVLIDYQTIEKSRFQWIEEALKEVFKGDPEMVLPMKYLDIGIRHLKKKEKNVLMELTKEERKVFKEFVLDKITD